MSDVEKKSADKIEIRGVRETDAEQINHLFGIVFKRERSVESFRWKFLSNPHGAGIVKVAVSGDAIVGFYGLSPRKVIFRNKEMTALQEVDLMVHPDHTRGGLFKKLGLAAYEAAQAQDTAFTFGFPNQTSLPAGRRILKWRAIEEIPLFTWVLDPTPVLKRRMSKLPDLAMPAVRGIWTGVRHVRTRSDIPVTEQKDIRPGTALIWDRIPKKPEIRFVRDDAYLNWRYMACPDHTYVFLYAGDSEGPDGFAILGIQSDGEAHLPEIWTWSVRATKALVRKAADLAVRAGCHSLRTWALHGSNQAGLLDGAEFMRRDSKIYHVIRSFRSPEFNRFLWDPARWSVSSGDSDCV